MPKKKISSRIRIALLNLMEAIGAAASHMASNAKVRAAEINLQSRRHEILTEFSLQAFEMWHNGVKLPRELSDMFVELSSIDDKLSVLRAQKYVEVKVECEVEGPEGEEPVAAECTVEMPAEEKAAQPAETPPAESQETPKKPRPSIRKKAAGKQ